MQATPATPARYREWDIYKEAPAAVREATDAVFAAVRNQTSPFYGLSRDHVTGERGCSFTWHDGAQYRVSLTADGELVRLFRYQYTGRLVDDGEGEMIPDAVWRTVREFSKDRAGRILGPALAGLPAAKSWAEASAK